jgi:C1A family cysteine protease
MFARLSATVGSRISRTRGTTASLPPQADLRPQCPPVYDQGKLGSCTANAIGAAFQFAQDEQKLADFAPSRLFIYYNERVIEHSVDTDSGAMIRDGLKAVGKLGVCPETEWPYDIDKFADRPSRECYTAAKKHQSVSYGAVSQQLDELKGCLASGTPVVFGFTVRDSFESQEVAKTGVVPMPADSEGVLGGHAVLAVGYDDSTERFWVRNSWGSDWGAQGYCSMPYAMLTDPKMASDFWAIYTVES